MNKNYLFLIMIMFVTASCTSTPTKDINVDVQTDTKTNLSGYKSYTWLGSAAIINDSSGQWEPPGFDADAEIKYLLDRELRARGKTESTTAPDLIVAFAAGIDMDALDFKMDPETKIDKLENVPQGGLVVILVDSSTGFIVWLGIATAEIQENFDVATVKVRLDYVVTQMMIQLPK